MIVSLVAALASNRVIGVNNTLPWKLQEDLKYFRLLTEGHAVVMGRKTFDSIMARGGRPLPKRENWVVSRSPASALKLPEGVRHANSLEAALKTLDQENLASSACMDQEEVFVVGGGQIYEAALPLANRLYLTLIDHPVEGDAYFPEWKHLGFKMTSEDAKREPFAFRFTVWEK